MHFAIAFAILCVVKLGEYLKRLPLGGQKAFAERVGINAAYLSQLSTGFRVPSVEVAAKIERESEGDVPAREWLPAVDWDAIAAAACSQQSAGRVERRRGVDRRQQGE